MTDAPGGGIGARTPVSARTTAGRLLDDVAASGSIDLVMLARRLGITVARIAECRLGLRPLELETQIVLAGVVTVLAPQHARLARRLHAQAQSALRVREGAVESHQTYGMVHRWNA